VKETKPVISLRHAQKKDAPAIYQMIWQAHLNPLGIHWRRFIVAVDVQGRIVGCGQIKPHADGSRELASIMVKPNYRRQGIAGAIILHLLQSETLPVYLTCRSDLRSFYEQFGFRVLEGPPMPPYFQRISRLMEFITKITKRPNRLLIMRRE
jgi:amino-acid N-acetyltransferase